MWRGKICSLYNRLHIFLYYLFVFLLIHHPNVFISRMKEMVPDYLSVMALDCVYALVSPELHGYLKSGQLETLIDCEGFVAPPPVEVKGGGACGIMWPKTDGKRGNATSNEPINAEKEAAGTIPVGEITCTVKTARSSTHTAFKMVFLFVCLSN